MSAYTTEPRRDWPPLPMLRPIPTMQDVNAVAFALRRVLFYLDSDSPGLAREAAQEQLAELTTKFGE